MKNKSLLYTALSACLLFAVSSCEDEDKLAINFDELKVSGGAYAQQVAADGVTDINKSDPASVSFSRTYQLVTPAGEPEPTSADLYVSFNGASATAPEIVYSTVSAGSFDTSGQYPQITFTINGADLLTALGLTADQLDGGDAFNYRIAVSTSERTYTDVSANFDNQSADHTFTSLVVCIPPTYPGGTWRIDMADAFGDGWQTTTADGGPGLTLTLSSGEVFEVGLCSPYEPTFPDCVPDFNSGSVTIDVPSGAESGDWFFPGDFWGEISFEIYGPSGTQVVAVAAGSGAGSLVLNLCNEAP